MPILPNIIFVILIAVATGYLTFLTSKGGLTDNRFNGFFKKITNRGKKVINILIFLVALLTLQEINSQRQGSKKDLDLSTERQNRDSIIASKVSLGVDSSRRRLFEDITIAFSKQGFVLDTVGNNVFKIKERANTLYSNILTINDRQERINNYQSKYIKTDFSIALQIYRSLEQENIISQNQFIDLKSFNSGIKNMSINDTLTRFTKTINEILRTPLIVENEGIRNEWLKIRDTIFNTPYQNEYLNNFIYKPLVYDSLKRQIIEQKKKSILKSREKIASLIIELKKKNGVTEIEPYRKIYGN